MSEGCRSQLKEPQWPQLKQCEQQIKVVLDYNSKYKINSHQPTLIEIIEYKSKETNLL